jgi:hypothetical protein
MSLRLEAADSGVADSFAEIFLVGGDGEGDSEELEDLRARLTGESRSALELRERLRTLGESSELSSRAMAEDARRRALSSADEDFLLLASLKTSTASAESNSGLSNLGEDILEFD